MSNVSSGFVYGGANAGKWIDRADDAAKQVVVVVDERPIAPPTSPANASTLTASELAKQQGYTGDICTNCGGAHMQVAGHCMVCNDCGTTTGCS